MKKILLLLLIILSINISFGKVLLGVDLRYEFEFDDDRNKDSIKDSYSSSLENQIYLSPRIGIMPSKFLEISPFLIFGLYTLKREEEYFANTGRATSFDLGCGIATYFHIIRGEIIHLSLGPQLQFLYEFKPYGNLFPDYDKYVNVDLSVGSPLNLDFHLNDKFAIRFSSNIIAIKYYRYLYKYEDKSYSCNDFDIDLRSILSPALGFFFTIK